MLSKNIVKEKLEESRTLSWRNVALSVTSPC